MSHEKVAESFIG